MLTIAHDVLPFLYDVSYGKNIFFFRDKNNKNHFSVEVRDVNYRIGSTDKYEYIQSWSELMDNIRKRLGIKIS